MRQVVLSPRPSKRQLTGPPCSTTDCRQHARGKIAATNDQRPLIIRVMYRVPSKTSGVCWCVLVRAGVSLSVLFGRFTGCTVQLCSWSGLIVQLLFACLLLCTVESPGSCLGWISLTGCARPDGMNVGLPISKTLPCCRRRAQGICTAGTTGTLTRNVCAEQQTSLTGRVWHGLVALAASSFRCTISVSRARRPLSEPGRN